MAYLLLGCLCTSEDGGGDEGTHQRKSVKVEIRECPIDSLSFFLLTLPFEMFPLFE